jgi:aminopeptidase N
MAGLYHKGLAYNQSRTMGMLRMANCLLWSGIISLAAAPASRPYTIENYDVSIRPDLANQRLKGEVRIRLHSQVDTAISALELDADALQIASVEEGQDPQYFERKGSLLFVVLTHPLRADEHRTITVRYQAGPSPGLKFFSDQAYGSVISDWMPSNDRPGERATLDLSIATPQDIKVAASGLLTDTRTSNGQTSTEWRLDSAAEPSSFGFALGSFAENTSDAEGVELRVLGAGTEVFEPTKAAMRYLTERSGKPYPGKTYTQVFLHGEVIRSLAAGLTLLPESYAQGKGTDTPWRVTTELARQWYGIQIAPKDWADIWLSEGVSAFLADTFLEQRLGKERYEKEIERSRQIYNQLRAQGNDRSLSYTGWTTRADADGEIPAHKGVCFLYLVHELVGDSAFWERLRLYTSERWGQSATSEEFQVAFQGVNPGNPGDGKKRVTRRGDAAAKPLDKLFDLWVYGIPTSDKKK